MEKMAISFSPQTTMAPQPIGIMMRPSSPVPSSDSSSSSPIVQSSEARRALLGPFSILMTFSGLDMERSLFGNKKPLPRAIFSTILYIFLIIVFILRLIVALSVPAKPLSFIWAESSVIGFMSLHGKISAICIGRWTASGTFNKIYSTLNSVKKSHSLSLPRSSLHSSRSFITALVLSTLFIIVTLTSSAKSAIQGPFTSNATNTGWQWVLSRENLFGFEPILSVWMAVSSILATISFVFIHRVVHEELKSFLSEIEESAHSGQLAIQLSSISTRLTSLLNLSSEVTEQMTMFASIGVLTSVIANVNALYIMMTLGSIMSPFSIIVTVMWVFSTVAFLLFTLNPPANVQSSLHKISFLLSSDPSIEGSHEKMTLVSHILRRLSMAPTRIFLMSAVPLGMSAPHMAMLVVPNIATLLSLLYRYLNY